MRYTVSAAFVIDCPEEEFDRADQRHIHRTIVEKISTFGLMLRTQFPDEDFRVLLTQMIFATEETEIAPRKTNAGD